MVLLQERSINSSFRGPLNIKATTLTENGFLIRALEEKSLVKDCLKFSEAAFETANGREIVQRSASMRLRIGKYSWPELLEASKCCFRFFLIKV